MHLVWLFLIYHIKNHNDFNLRRKRRSFSYPAIVLIIINYNKLWYMYNVYVITRVDSRNILLGQSLCYDEINEKNVYSI